MMLKKTPIDKIELADLPEREILASPTGKFSKLEIEVGLEDDSILPPPHAP